MDMPEVSRVNDILMELMFQVDNENPITKEVTMKLNEFADAVASGGPEVRESVLDLEVNDELCLSMETGNVVPGIHNLFKHRADNKTLMRNTVSLLRNLCVNREIRDRVSTYALMKYIVDMLSAYQKDKEMVEIILYCCAYMTLKNACQVSQFIAKGGLQVALQVMTDHSTDVIILKPGCLTLRNVVENGEDGKDKMKDIGFHVFLNSLMSSMQQLTAFYLVPVLKYMGLSSTSFVEDEAHYSGPENVQFEPQPSRPSVIIDED